MRLHWPYRVAGKASDHYQIINGGFYAKVKQNGKRFYSQHTTGIAFPWTISATFPLSVPVTVVCSSPFIPFSLPFFPSLPSRTEREVTDKVQVRR